MILFLFYGYALLFSKFKIPETQCFKYHGPLPEYIMSPLTSIISDIFGPLFPVPCNMFFSFKCFSPDLEVL